MENMEDVMSQLKKQAKKVETDQARLEQLVVKAHGDGKSLREIAAVIGKTPEGVRKMVARVAGPLQIAPGVAQNPGTATESGESGELPGRP
jgi:transposase